jgi:hypothetical protein
MMQKFVVPFVNSAGLKCLVEVELSDDEVRDCLSNPRTAGNIAFAYAAQRALRSLPAGFGAQDLVVDQICGHSVH